MQRSLCLALLAACSLMAQPLHVDHASVAGRSLAALTDALHRAGIPSQYGGPHANHATEMALTSFSDGSYLEMIAIQEHADPAAVAAHEWHAFLETGGEPCSWAIHSPANISAEIDRLRAASISVGSPRKGGRKRPDGVQMEWENTQIGPTNGGFFPFMIHDFTPRERRAFPSGKPTTTQWTGIVKVVIAVQDLDAAIAQYRRAFALAAPLRQDDADFGARLAWFTGTPVVLAAPISSESWLEARIRRFGEVPCAFVLGRATGNTVATKSNSHWFGKEVGWIDPDALGWHLGAE